MRVFHGVDGVVGLCRDLGRERLVFIVVHRDVVGDASRLVFAVVENDQRVKIVYGHAVAASFSSFDAVTAAATVVAVD